VTVLLNPYLNFRGQARAAIEFYQSVFGGELTISTFGDFQMSHDPAGADLVMHSQLTADNGFVLMVSDTPSDMDLTPGTNFGVSLSGDDEELLRGYWNKLVDGGTASVPLEKAPWGDSFGMCTDKFGTSWLVNISGAAA
jgi:PhnB protein